MLSVTLQARCRDRVTCVLYNLVVVALRERRRKIACGGANWYDLGERDGLFGVQPRIETYAYGWWLGNATYRDRTAGSEGH